MTLKVLISGFNLRNIDNLVPAITLWSESHIDARTLLFPNLGDASVSSLDQLGLSHVGAYPITLETIRGQDYPDTLKEHFQLPIPRLRRILSDVMRSYRPDIILLFGLPV